MTSSPSRPVTLFFLLLALILPATVLAQGQGTAELRGVVLDASGKPAAGYPMKLTTELWGEVIMHPTEDDGSFVVNGLPAGTYELRVFEPSGSNPNPIASKKVTLADGQAEPIEIRVGSATTGSSAAGTSLASIGINWTAVVIAGMALATGLVVFFVVRTQRRTG